MGEVTSIQIMGNTMSEPSDDPTCEINRRNCLGATGAALLGVTGLSALSKMALAASPAESEDDEILYGHGMVWNRQLPGVAGALNLSFDMRVNLDTGLGAAVLTTGPSRMELSLCHRLDRNQASTRGEHQFIMRGAVIDANDPTLVGLPVRIIAETRRGTTAIAIAVGDLAFAGAGLVVIAIIAILIALYCLPFRKYAKLDDSGNLFFQSVGTSSHPPQFVLFISLMQGIRQTITVPANLRFREVPSPEPA